MKFESEQHCNTILPVLSICSERFSAYQNTAALFGKPQQDVAATPSSSLTSELGSSNTLQLPERKKPVPLPRSKIPVSQQSQSQTQSQTQTQSQQQQPKKQPSAAASLHARFFSKRAKTDLGFDGLAAYKAGKRPPGGTKYPAPKVPTFNRPVPQQRQQQQPSQSQMTQSQSQSQPRFNLPQKQQQKETTSSSSNKASKKPEAKIKPEIKEKPLFSTFKQREQNDSFRFVT